jgi:protein TonB
MFEQSMLFDSAPRKKAGALAVSLTVQTLVVGTMFLIPLLYTERLAFIQPSLPVFLPSFHPPEPPPQPAVPLRPTQISTGPRVFRAPTSSPPLAYIHDIGDPPLAPETSIHTEGLPVGLPIALPMIRILPPPPAVQPVSIEKAPEAPVRIGGTVLAAKIMRKVTPLYPRLAIMARISGTVRLLGVVAKDGTIQQLQVVSGPPMLVNAALEAVRQWTYSPTLLNGQPVEVSAPIDVVFTLAQ